MDITHTLNDDLKALRLPYIRENYPDSAKNAIAKGLGHVDFLHSLIHGEREQRLQRATQRRLRSATFPFLRTMETYNFSHPEKIDRMRVQHLFRLDFLADCSNVIFVGNTGLGKTHLAVALTYHASLQGYKVLYSSATTMVNELIAAQAQHRLPQALKRFVNPDILMIDELGYLPIDKLGADLLFQVISGRYERGSIILTSNLIFKHWSQIFSGDATLTSAALDRLVHHHELIIIEGESYRMKKSTN